ncbi:MAG: response regulator, partial [Chthoniobacterales bacterium]
LLEIAGNQEGIDTIPGAPEETAPVSDHRALIVEDDPTSRKLLLRMLKNFGIEADHAPNGHVCLEMNRSSHYDFIFMDVRLPEMDGVETTRRIRETEQSNPDHKRSYIIAITAQAMAGDEEDCLAAGMDGYLSKPVRLTEIERILSTYSK